MAHCDGMCMCRLYASSLLFLHRRMGPIVIRALYNHPSEKLYVLASAGVKAVTGHNAWTRLKIDIVPHSAQQVTAFLSHWASLNPTISPGTVLMTRGTKTLCMHAQYVCIDGDAAAHSKVHSRLLSICYWILIPLPI